MSKYKLTKKELEILTILWGSDKPLTARQIIEKNPSLGMSTVQSVLKKLAKNKLIETAEIVYSGTVLTRSYSPIVDEETFILDQYDDFSMSKLLAGFLVKQPKEELGAEISKIEKLLEEKKKELLDE
ncbi:BlaI/MecI/CopY family transcriptional regulator [Enterococcus sp. 669A]|uniref:BlaI/MecI/CopY family transcriptional regulator n=1 Tax=Candidatus Enterococcus moelleringii TaxID=2815325 RepID=A0ABS3LGD0_9ENTE|nr:BlaI/MecI/CopY family transcriptional regulator [Enterococcus sp. 669A]MBO1308680.1 BlaI/MecI/CopY family transcriptional regulator [Enterococcus sp. 669A]